MDIIFKIISAILTAIICIMIWKQPSAWEEERTPKKNNNIIWGLVILDILIFITSMIV